MITVAIESPYAANERFSVEDHVAYARAAMLDSLRRGEAPFASHLLYTQVLDDGIAEERAHGMAAGLALSLRLDLAAFYVDLGWSRGMEAACQRYPTRMVDIRSLFGEQVTDRTSLAAALAAWRARP